MATIGKNILIASQLLKEGKLLAIPTETVYGLAANGLNDTAVARIFEAKNRPYFDPLILHVHSLEQALLYVKHIPEPLLKLAHQFWPGPLTLLLEKTEIVSDLVTSGLEKVALRVPNHALCLQLLKELDFPLAAPSANPFGYISPTQPEHVNKQLGEKVEYILDGGICEVGLESTIVGMEEGKIYVYRLGGLSIEDLEKCVGKVSVALNSSSNPKAPGQLKSHYAPKKQFILGNLEENIRKYKNPALIFFGKDLYVDVKNKFNLSATKNVTEAASNLFKALREMDESDSETILCNELPAVGLGNAINDRLLRASQK